MTRCASALLVLVCARPALAHDPIERFARGDYAGLLDDALRTGWVTAGLSAILGPAIAMWLIQQMKAGRPAPPPSYAYPLITDRGTAIPNRPRGPHPDLKGEVASENGRLKKAGLANRVRRIVDPTGDFNCHGYVFGNAVTEIGGKDAETILSENGYVATTSPAVGDVIVYRGPDGRITHSGQVVRVENGQSLVHSKWGTGSVFEHRGQDVPEDYGKGTYYRGRGGQHILKER